jgi:hypothetical protein
MLTQVNFCLFSMRLSQSHDLGHEFGKLTQVNFFCYFFIFFSTSSFNIRLIEN